MLPAIEPAFGGIRLFVVLRRLPRVLPALALVGRRSVGRRRLLADIPCSREASPGSRTSMKAPTHDHWSVCSIGVSLNRTSPQYPLDRKGAEIGTGVCPRPSTPSRRCPRVAHP